MTARRSWLLPAVAATAVVVLVALAVVAAVVLVRRGGGDPVEPLGPDVLLVGDSVTYDSAAAIRQELDPVRPEFVARPGFTSGDLLPLVRTAMAEPETPAGRRQRVAVLVGYNDIHARRLDTAALPALVRQTSLFRCAVWLTLPARPGGEEATNDFVPSDLVDEWNRRMVREAARYDNVHVATDWADAVTAAPASELLRPDGVHPVEAGRQALADAYGAALARSCPDG